MRRRAVERAGRRGDHEVSGAHLGLHGAAGAKADQRPGAERGHLFTDDRGARTAHAGRLDGYARRGTSRCMPSSPRIRCSSGRRRGFCHASPRPGVADEKDRGSDISLAPRGRGSDSRSGPHRFIEQPRSHVRRAHRVRAGAGRLELHHTAGIRRGDDGGSCRLDVIHFARKQPVRHLALDDAVQTGAAATTVGGPTRAARGAGIAAMIRRGAAVTFCACTR